MIVESVPMSGHSKWAQIKRQKGANDARRGAVFTKVAREISIAARGGGDPDANYRLRMAVDKARSLNMPMDNIKRAIERGSGSGSEAEAFEEIVYEGYGPGGVAILVEAATDNRNRTAADVRAIFTKAGGQLAGTGAVAWQFEQRGVITVPRDGQDPDEVALAAIDAGATDVDVEADPLEVTTAATDLEQVRKELEEAGYAIETAELTMQPLNTVEVDAGHARQNLRLVEHLEDQDDVQRVTANFDIPEEVFAEVSSA
jgi:YebC/PmpR family DNA-binding regulatory protein